MYKIKYKSNGEVEIYNARIILKGYCQREGIDYEVTFSLVAKWVTITPFITVAINYYWLLFQLDINNSFLYVEFY